MFSFDVNYGKVTIFKSYHKFPRIFYVKFLGYVVVVARFNTQQILIQLFLFVAHSQQTNSRWRVIRWFQMPTSTSGGNDSCAPGSTSQPASTADVRIASPKPRPCSHAQLPVHCVPLWDAHPSAITQSCVPAVDSRWPKSRWVSELFRV